MKTVPLLALCSLIIAVPSVWASWVQDGVALCTAAGNQSYPAITSDSAGGAIVTWLDYRSGNGHIYAQRVNASGAMQWVIDGVPICTATGNQSYPAITSDGTGGAIVTWHDSRTGNPKIYAQRVNRSGAVQWRSDGVALGPTTSGGQDFAITSDGAGGAIVAWLHYHHLDYRRGNVRRIYVQRVNSFGVVQWRTKGVALCAATGDEYSPTIVSDGAGGAIVTWLDRRSLSTWDIYAQHVNASGAIQWDPNGVPLCAATGDFAQTVSDGAGGAIVTWDEKRAPKDWDIYVQRVNASGAVQWTPHGVALCTAKGDQVFPTIVSDGASGAIVTWYDKRIETNYDIYAQRVDASGAVQWTTDGVALCTATGDQMNPTITSDGASGAIVTWFDIRTRKGFDIYAQRVNASGAVQWTTNGLALCAATGDQLNPMIISDGAGGAFVVWLDQRSNFWHIYALRVDADGSCAVNGY